jgi:hypothetical protein
MTNLRLYLTVGLPTFAIVASLIVSLVQISGIRGEILGIRGELSGVRDDLREIRGDMKLLTGKVYEMMGLKG